VKSAGPLILFYLSFNLEKVTYRESANWERQNIHNYWRPGKVERDLLFV